MNPLHTHERFKIKLQHQQENDHDKIKIQRPDVEDVCPIHPRLRRKNRKVDDIQITCIWPQHPRDSLRRKIRDRIIKQEENKDRETVAYASDNDEIDGDVQITNVRPQHLRDRLRRTIRDGIIKTEENEDRETIA